MDGVRIFGVGACSTFVIWISTISSSSAFGETSNSFGESFVPAVTVTGVTAVSVTSVVVVGVPVSLKEKKEVIVSYF